MPLTIQRVRMQGGYRFRGFRGEAESRAASFDLSSHMRYPLGGLAKSLQVGEGDHVEVGQVVATPVAESGLPILATVSGTVSMEGGTIVVQTDSDQKVTSLEGQAEWESLSVEALEDRIHASGSCAVSASGIPTRYNTAPVGPGDITQIILCHTTSDVFSTDAKTILDNRDPAQIVQGIGILQRIMPGAQAHVVLAKDDDWLLQALRQQPAVANDDQILLHVSSNKYPQENEAVLVSSVLGGDYPNGFASIHTGVLIVDLRGILQVFDAVVNGMPFVDRLVAIHGAGFRENLHLKVRIGTPIQEIVDAYAVPEAKCRLIYNSVMTGGVVTDPGASVGADCTALIALPAGGNELLPFASPGVRKDSITLTFAASLLPVKVDADTNLHGEQRPCLSCTFCEQVCPVGLLPYVLHRYVQRDIIDEKLVRYGAFDCVDCNLCSYVCPSKIPLARLIAEGKKKLVEEGFDLSDATIEKFSLKGISRPEEAEQE